MFETATAWLADNVIVVVATLLLPLVWSVGKAKFPLVFAAVSAVLSRFRKTPEQTDTDVLLDLLKAASAKAGAPIPATPLDTKSEVIQDVYARLKALVAEKEKQLLDKLAGIKAAQ